MLVVPADQFREAIRNRAGDAFLAWLVNVVLPSAKQHACLIEDIEELPIPRADGDPQVLNFLNRLQMDLQFFLGLGLCGYTGNRKVRKASTLTAALKLSVGRQILVVLPSRLRLRF
jgi:hypothetical protein